MTTAIEPSADEIDLLSAAKVFVDHYDRFTCTHDSTHRGGVLWTICDECGQKWADDEGGFKPYVDPPEIAAARAAILAMDRRAEVVGKPDAIQEALSRGQEHGLSGPPSRDEIAALLIAMTSTDTTQPSIGRTSLWILAKQYLAALASPPAPAVAVPEGLTAYEAQVLIGTSISGCNMPPDTVFNLPGAWKRLRALDLIDRTDGLAIITEKGQAVVAAMLAAAPEPPATRSEEPATRAGWTYMPTYGEVSFKELVEAVAEAIYANRHFTKGAMAEIDRTRFTGHQMVPAINFNSLNRIVSAFVRSPPATRPEAEIRNEGGDDGR